MWFFLDLTTVLSSENSEKTLVLINWNCLPVIGFFYINQLLYWKAVSNSTPPYLGPYSLLIPKYKLW